MDTQKRDLLLEKARNIKLIAMDVDGVLTNGSIVVRDSGEELKEWNVRDRIAFYFTRRIAPHIKFVWITGRASQQIDTHAADMQIDKVYQNCMDKKQALADLLTVFNLTAEAVAYVGDDLIDIPVLRRVGLSACPLDAAPEVKNTVDYVSSFNGGKGVLRDLVELVLRSSGAWEKLVQEYLTQ